MENAKPATTPMAVNFDFSSEEEPMEKAREYRRVIGSLQYITMTRPDVQVAVNILSQFMANLKPKQWMAVKRVLRYLAGTQEFGITIQRIYQFDIHLSVVFKATRSSKMK